MSTTYEEVASRTAPRQLNGGADLKERHGQDRAKPAPDCGKDLETKRGREPAVDLEIRHDADFDFDATARLADEGFGFRPGTFQANSLRWLYEEAFSDGTTVLGVYAGERKVGHLALVHHSVTVEGRLESAVALMDLFILPAFRSRTAISRLYGETETLCRQRGIRFIIAMPNEKAAPVNRRHLTLSDVALCDIRIGLAWPLWPWHGVTSHRIGEITRADALPILERYCEGGASGLLWTGARLWSRLQKPGANYAFHAGERVLAISAPRSDRRADHTLICALLPRPGAIVRRRDVNAVIAASCRTHRRPLFVYTGLNSIIPKPGVPLPKRWRPSQMILQIRDFSGASPVPFDRFEPFDFDFC